MQQQKLFEKQLKIFLVCYSWDPSSPECSVVLAESAEDARMVIQKDGDLDSIYIEEIQEIEIDKNTVIYTGYYCC